jgi:hypothetical protein
MVEGGPIDVLTGDYLAELTMFILWKARQKDPRAGYATAALSQLEEVLGTCLDRGIKIVNNAGGLNPAGLVEQLTALTERLGLRAKIAHVTGDDLFPKLDQLLAGGHRLTNLDTGQNLTEARGKPVAANAYLGGWGIAAALHAGADIVICPRVTDASLAVGPAAWWHGWGRDDLDQLAGAVAAGHIIECGQQATGGNYPFLDEVADRRTPGFPVAEIAHDGSSVITKHEHTGGLVSVGTVTAQLLYEIAEPAYANPDVVAHFDRLTLEQDGPNRVRVLGIVGTPPPTTLKVGISLFGGYRNTMTLVITGLDIEEKAAWAIEEVFRTLGGREQLDDVDVRLLRLDRVDASANEQAVAHLRVTVMDRDARKVGRQFSDAVTQLALGSYAGFHTTTPPARESAYAVYWPTLIPATSVSHVAVLHDGTTVPIPPTAAVRHGAPPTSAGRANDGTSSAKSAAESGVAEPVVRVPLGRICGARSGDKGGNANVAFWTRDDASYAWMRRHLTVDELLRLLPEANGMEVRRFELPNVRAVNFVIVGLLGEGVASSTRPDPQAKGLGEYLRSRLVTAPLSLVDQLAAVDIHGLPTVDGNLATVQP